MKTIELRAKAKINLSIDVLGKRPDGYHDVVMVMQQVDLWDKLTISYEEEPHVKELTGNGKRIFISTTDSELPDDERNLAFKSALLLKNRFPEKAGKIHIHIDKRIPAGAGLGGGSADAAAVFHGLNMLWNLKLSPAELMELALTIGADIPFLIMSQAASEPGLNPDKNRQSAMKRGLSTCALAEGKGEKLTPLPPLKAAVLLKKPDLFVSTKEIYESLDLKKIEKRPDTRRLIEGLLEGNFSKVASSMHNVLEEVATSKYPVIQETVNWMKAVTGAEKVMMSGSGPTVFALIDASAF